ncbi:MAG: DUF4097 domain-containing protein [Firmicutes bacterium]|nr:DUF4097 domain-containing protein [Bacillota bacterium]
MKKKFLIFASILGILAILAGGVVFTIGMTGLGWDFKKIDREEISEAKSFESDQAVNSVTLKGDWNYTILRGEEFKVEYYESDQCNYDIGVSGGAFRLIESRKSWISYIGIANGFKRSGYTVTVTLTEDSAVTIRGSSATIIMKEQNFKSVSVRGSSAKLTMENAEVAGDITFDGSDAWTEFENVKAAGNITFGGSSLRASLKGVTARDVKMTGSDARLTMTGTAENVITANDITLKGSSIGATLTYVTARDFKISGSDTRLTLAHVTARNVTAGSSSCKATLQDSSVSERIHVGGSDARLTMNGSSAKEVSVKGSSLRVETDSADIRAFSGTGSDLRVTLNLIGAVTDIKSATVSGSSATLRIDEAKMSGGYHNAGYKTFSATGSSVSLRINMKGGESIFSE